jgi:hypothetical protein
MATTKLHLQPIGPICGKHRHYSPDEVEREISKLQWRDRAEGKPAVRMSIYWCDACNAFHITRRSS